jgi:hypothetical protein
MGYKSFKEHCDNKLNEDWWKRFGRSKVPVKPKNDIPDDIHVSDPPYARKEKVADQEFDNTLARFGEGNFFSVLSNFRTKDGRFFPPDIVSRLSQSGKLVDDWNTNYKDLYNSAKKQPATQQAIVQKALQLMGVNDSWLQSYEAPTPPEHPIPELKAIADYARRRLQNDRGLSAERLKQEIYTKFPGISRKYAPAIVKGQLTRLIKRLLKPSLVPTPEPEPVSQDGIINFDRARERINRKF